MLFNKFKERKCFVAVGLLLLFCACGGKDFLYHENVAIANEVWETENRIPFQFSVADTNTAYRVGLTVRYTLNFPKQNMYVFIYTNFPNGRQSCDTVSVNLFAMDGTPYGKGKRIKELNVPVAKLRFPMSGQYTIHIEQGMRTDALEGVVSMGLYIMKPIEK